MEQVVRFFQLNGFVYWERLGYLRNENCTIFIHNDCYEVMNTDGESYFTNSHTVYELIGYLTYYDLMNKDFEKNIG